MRTARILFTGLLCLLGVFALIAAHDPVTGQTDIVLAVVGEISIGVALLWLGAPRLGSGQ